MLRLGHAQAELLARHVELFTALGGESILASGETHVALSWMAAKRDNAAAADVAIVRCWFGEVVDFFEWLRASTAPSAETDFSTIAVSR